MNLLVLPGDDIGPEIAEAALAVLNRADALFSLNLRLEQRFGPFSSQGCRLEDLEEARRLRVQDAGQR